MSAPACKRTDYDDAQERELARWPGVTWSREVKGKHYALVLSYRGISRFVIYPSTPGDSRCGALNHLQNVRKVLTELGAERDAERRATGPHRQRNRTEPGRLVISDRCEGGPKRDPWAALATLKIAEPVVEPPAPRVSWWAWVLAFLLGRRA